ncbi:extracellular solute-binding protein [Pseudohongiella spirulinae]|uniref:ABC-type dipeptide transport system, periplasmic component n=1 Tax=Pseudohongiella spirulinae TaxID=1249552 RepID=A0A0S2KAT1_9GAMM|nr:extracellular solute-binding protein [Pseudohongiella spirulinae]ALO45253.1 ABC-type dipeptide transport system, periplasmic component [Pseudohongiella spirulinae]
MIRQFRTGLLMLVASVLVACGGGTEETVTRDNTQEVLDYYAAYPDFFRFRTVADLPADLEWEDGMDLPDLGSPDAVKGGTQFGSVQDFPRTLRHVGPDSNGSFRPWILDDVTLGLAHGHPDVEFAHYPALASSWAIDADTSTVYARLDPDARWSTGEPVTVDDFFFMFFFFQSDYIVAPWYNNYYGVGQVYNNITRYDDLTLSITLNEAKPDLADRVLALRPVPQHFYKELGDDFVERYQWRFVPTTGPYVIRDEDIIRGRSITVTRLQDWWAKDKKFFRNRFNIDRTVMNVIRDTNNVFEAFKRGDIDQFGLNLAEHWYEKLPDSDPDVAGGYIHKSVFYNERPRPTYGLWMNTSRPLLDNQNVRLGIQYATNWDLVIESFFRGDYARMQTSSDGYGEFSHPTLQARPFDIDRALEHFARAGFTERGRDGILVNDQGQRLAFTLTTGYESLSDILTILREEAARAGLEFRIEVLDQTAGWQKVQEKQHDIAFTAFGVSVEMYPRFWETYHSANAYDNAFLSDGTVNPEREVKVQTNNLEMLADYEFDQMIEQYDRSSDRDEMLDLAHRMTAYHHDYASFVPGFVQDFYRVGHWRWVRYPDFFNHRQSGNATELHVHWIDTQMKEQTLAARSSGQTFEPQLRVHDQWRPE